MKTPVFVALDVDTDKRALEIADQVHDFVGGFKVGPRLVLRYGAPLLKEIARRGLLFIDNKYHDIPSTMIAAVKASFEMGASFVTIHASAGPVALSQLAALEKELNREREFRLLAVTVLTSFSESTLPANWASKKISEQVELLAHQTLSQGVSGLVCSPFEVKELRKKYPQAFLLTPGIRPESQQNAGKKDDQERVATPRSALEDGSSALVIGRPIVQASSPRSAAQAIYQEIQDMRERR